MNEQRETLAEALWRHKMARPDGASVTWCACLGWSATRGDLDSDERAYNAHVADALARLLADAEQRGADRVAAAVEAWLATQVDSLGGQFHLVRVTDLRAAFTPGAADRVRAEAWAEGYRAAMTASIGMQGRPNQGASFPADWPEHNPYRAALAEAEHQ